MDTAFIELQMKWYGVLAQEGFPEIEDVRDPERVLLKWSGVSHNHIVESERAHLPSWPENPFVMQEELLYHPELPMVCESVCKHGNSSLTPHQIRKILEMHLHGMTCRDIGVALQVTHIAVFRAQKKLNEWARLLESRDD